MRKFGSFLASALLVVAVGCGSDSTGTSKIPDSGVTPRLDTGVIPTVDAPVTTPGIDAPVTTPGIDAPVTTPGIDAPVTIGVDGSVTPRLDGGVTPGLDGGATPRLDGGTTPRLDGGTTPRLDGGTVIDTGKGVDSGAIATTCILPTCMQGVAENCVPSGACVTQTDTLTGSTNTCYANGVKMVQQTGVTGINISFKNAGAVCYSMSVDLAAILAAAGGAPISIPVKNAAGTAVATLSVDTTTQKTTVTCPGAQPVALDSSCTGSMSVSASATPNNCTQGTCAP